MEESRVMCTNEALINNRRTLHSSSAGDLVPYLPSSVRATLYMYKIDLMCLLALYGLL